MKHYFKWKRNWLAVIERDRGQCFFCGQTSSTVSHIVPKSHGDFPELHEKKNMACTCEGKCHDKSETYEGRCQMLEVLARLYDYKYPEEAFREYTTEELK